MKLTTLLLNLLILVSLAPLTRAAENPNDWPRFRGPTGTGLSGAANVPTQWSETENVAWKVDVPGKGWSSPVVSNGRIYVTTAIAQPLSLRVLCFDAASGKTLWNTQAFAPDAGAFKSVHSKNGRASPTPVVTADRVYAHFGHMGTAALDLAGKLVWKNDELRYSPVHGNAASPILVNGLLVFSADGAANPSLVALDAATGKLRWRTARNTTARKTFSFATPLAIDVAGQTQIVSPASGFVGGYDPATGKEIWRATYGEGYSVVPAPVFAQGLIVCSSGFDKAVMYAIDPKGAAGDVTHSHVRWRIDRNASHTPSPIVVGDEVYFASDSGFANCADLKTGKVHWSQRLGGNFSASPVAAGGHLYFPNEAGVTYVLKAGTKYELISKNDLADRTFASPAPIDNAIIIRSESHLWRIGK
jgi:outer membrane protein assembly factor BamB